MEVYAVISDIKEYEIIQNIDIKELDSKGILLKHKKTGARIALLPNTDNNKTFCVGFRTPVTNDTGVPHIIEHSVLCGSNKFDVKDPFMELVKGSLNTFLNAMTYPDKTLYPVASTNDADFHNLVDVYMDAVFNPNIYKHEEIFKQEGWSYNLESPDDKLTYNGVVYNEMKGAFSSPDDVLERQIMHSLYPDTCYANESGGAPESIPSLAYEEYLEFHRTFYHPSNSYIYLYGDANMEEYLRWIDEEYLSKYDYLEVDSKIELQDAFETTREEIAEYSITENESEEDNTYLSYNVVTGISGDKVEYIAYKILDYALCSMPGAPIKKALIDAGIGNDIYGGYSECMYQPYFSIIAKNANASDKDRFIQIIKDTLKDIVENGVDEDSIRAGINVFEFQFREADFGSYPKGLIYGLQMFDTWLYDDNKPFVLLQANETFEILKKNIGTGYYEELIEKKLLNNPHSSVVMAVPCKGLTLKRDRETEEKLAAYKASLSEEEINKLVEDTKALKEYKDEPSKEENLRKIPLLKISDISKKSEVYHNEFVNVDGTDVLTHNIFTNGIAYIKALFNITDIPKNAIPYLGLLKSIIGYMDTTKHTYSEISNLVNLNSGGIGFGIKVIPDYREGGTCNIYAELKSRVMYDKIDFAFDMLEEFINDTVFDDEKRLKEILDEVKSRLEVTLMQSGNSIALQRSMSYLSEASKYSDMMKGIGFYGFVSDIVKNYEDKKSDIIKNLKAVVKYIFRKDNMLLSCTADAEGIKLLDGKVGKFVEMINGNEDTAEFESIDAMPEYNINEAFKTSAQIQYVAQTGNFKNKGFEYSGYVRVLGTILNYEYLWNAVRVHGGAYGCSSSFNRKGNGGFSSYRDPNLEKTFANYRAIPEYLENVDFTEREMTKFIIGTISGMDTPLTPSSRGNRSLMAYVTHLEYDTIQKERDEVLSTTAEKIRGLAPLVRALLECDNICVIGNEGKIEEAKDLFKETKNLLG